MTKPIGLYVHIPFCVRKCNYCDFCSVSEREHEMQKYVDVLISEIESYKTKNVLLDTVFIGGGTPSLLSPKLFEALVRAIFQSFNVTSDAEFSVEANPGTLTREKLALYKSLGVNRLSLGVQSVHENELKMLGRIHTYDEFLVTYNMARELGLDNINVDLMYGIPYQTVASFERTLESVISLSPEHISCYGLIIEEGTPFFKYKDKLPLPTEDEECDMYYLADSKLEACGYVHYEISNYSKPNKFCRHNLKYWKDEEYIGVGLSAHSYFENTRYYNSDVFSEYYENFSAKYEYENRGCNKDPFEYVMLAMRLSDGLFLSQYEEIFGTSFLSGREEKISLYISQGLMLLSDDRLSLTPKGFYVSNSILTELL